MNLRFQMIDTDTGEILGTSYKNYALNFADKKDTGFIRCLEWCMSAVRGIRSTEHKNIEVRIFFGTEKQPLSLFEQNEIKETAKCVLTNV